MFDLIYSYRNKLSETLFALIQLNSVRFEELKPNNVRFGRNKLRKIHNLIYSNQLTLPR